MPIFRILLSRTCWLTAVSAVVLLSTTSLWQAQSGTSALERTVVVSVMGENGKNLRGLESNYFQGTFRGKSVGILAAEESPPHRVVLLYDISGSMTGERPAPRLAAERFLALMPPQVPVGFISFATKTRDQFEFQTDRSQILSALRSADALNWQKTLPKGGGETALFDSLSAAVKMFGKVEPGDSIMIVSDGGENASYITDRQIRPILEGSGLRIYAVVPTLPVVMRSRSPEEIQGTGDLLGFGKGIGGDTWFFDVDELHHFLQETPPSHQAAIEKHLANVFAPIETLVREMNGFYVLKIRLPEPVEKPHGWRLEVIDPQTGKPDHHLIVHYPSQLFPLGDGGP